MLSLLNTPYFRILMIYATTLLLVACEDMGPQHLDLTPKEERGYEMTDIERFIDKDTGSVCYKSRATLGMSCLENLYEAE